MESVQVRKLGRRTRRGPDRKIAGWIEGRTERKKGAMTEAEKKYRENLIKLAEEAFAGHELIAWIPGEDPLKAGRWFIRRRRKDTFHAAEIIALWNGRLFVGGDIDDVTFGYYRDSDDHLDRVRWIATSGLDYITEKAQIGMTDGGVLATDWNSAVAGEQLTRLLDTEMDFDSREVIRRARDLCLDGGSKWAVMEPFTTTGTYAWDHLPDDLGIVPSARVVYAWAACKRLIELTGY
jgi:hypothetical protein